MAEVLLNSGSLQQYAAIGDEGQPIYSVATQLRETVRLKVGAAAAACLAIPRVNEARSSIDWYSPRQGLVVPWSAATASEREAGLRELDQYHQQILTAVSRLDGVSDREKRIVQNLLSKVFIFPRPDCLFLVDGKPVLTFWGFQQGKDSVVDPFYALRTTGLATPVSGAGNPSPLTADTPTTVRRRPWWLWLLGLVLLAALLLWLLRACTPNAVLTPESPIPLEPAGALPIPAVNEPVAEPGLVSDVQRWWRTVSGAQPQTSEVVPGVLGGAEVLSDPDATRLPGTAEVVPDAVPEPTQEPKANPPEAMAEGATAPETPPETPPATPPESTLPATNELSPPSTEPPNSVPNPLNGTNPTADSPAVEPPTTPSQPNSVPPGLGAPMTIPPNALQSGSVDFLNGRWRAAGGLQDAQTGQPVRLQYQFDQGQAKVTVDRGNGIQCHGTSQSAIVGGKLQMSNQATTTQCSDGSSFVLPQVTCTPDASGRSQCSGIGPDGKALPITIRQMP